MMQIGIVGLPNVGKSTLFKALTNKQVDIQNYPFTTIDPNVGVVAVLDERVDALADFSRSAKKIYTTIEFIDIAGLVKGASQGEGLGNKFLANIREVDAIAHVVRVFDDSNVTHVHGDVDPASDIEIIQTELELADLQTKSRRSEKSGPRPKASGGKNKQDLPELDLLADKKVIFIFNCSEAQLLAGWKPEGKLLEVIGSRPYVALSNKLELTLTEVGPDEKKEYLNMFYLSRSKGSRILDSQSESGPESGLDTLIKTGYKTLGLLTFLTTGEDETRAWTAHIGDLIPPPSPPPPPPPS